MARQDFPHCKFRFSPNNGRHPPESLWYPNSTSSLTRRSRDTHCPVYQAWRRGAPPEWSQGSQFRTTHIYGAAMAGQDCCITLPRTLRGSLTSVLNSEAPDSLLSGHFGQRGGGGGAAPPPPPTVYGQSNTSPPAIPDALRVGWRFSSNAITGPVSGPKIRKDGVAKKNSAA